MRVRSHIISKVLGLIMCLVIFSGCGMNNLREAEVTGIVSEKQYQAAYNTYMAIDLLGEPHLQEISHEAKYLVLITYDDMYVVVDDKNLYDSVNVGDETKVILRTWEDDEGNQKNDIVWR